MKLHAQLLARNGRKEFVVLPYEEYQALQERLADADDLATLQKAMREDDRREPGMTPAELRKHLGLSKTPVRRPSKRQRTRG